MGISGNRVFTGSSDHLHRDPFTGNQFCTTVSGIIRMISIFASEAVLILVLISPVTALDWTTETVDSPGDVGWHTSLTLDPLGNPRISYMDWTNYDLKYAEREDGVWKNETVDSTGVVGEFTSLKNGLSGQPLISYYDNSRGNLSFAMKTGDTWTKVVVDTGSVGRYTSLAIDGSGNPHISYQDLLSAKLKYAHTTGVSWMNETADNSVNVGAFSSLALDSAGNPHISYYDANRVFLKYATKNGGLWTNQTVDSTGGAGSYTSLALDSSGNPHISYYDGVNRNLKYATKSGSTWTREIVDSAGSVGKYTSIAVDSSGNPHISYFDETNGHLKYAVKKSNIWTNSTVDNAPNVGMYTSIALDSAGNPRISYRDFGNNDLKYTEEIPPLHLNFTASTPYGPAPLTVQFSDTSTGGSPSLWNWSFGDGAWFNTSMTALRNPDHIYETPGTYSVTLTVRNMSVTSSLSRSGYITVVIPPETTVPTTSPTPVPTPTPTPSPTPEPTPSPTLTPPSPTPSATSTPTPTPTSSPTPEPTPSPVPVTTSTPSAGHTVQPGAPVMMDGSDSSDDILPAPSPAPVSYEGGLFRCQTVNVGGDSAVTRVSVTGEDIEDIIVTARKIVVLPAGVPSPGIPVYQYIDSVPSRYSFISGALIEFEVPLSAVDNDTSVNTVSLCVLSNRTWTCLPTFRSGMKNGMVLFRAESPEFSLFAITIRNDGDGSLDQRPPAVSPVPAVTVRESREFNRSIPQEIPVNSGSGGPDAVFSRMLPGIGIVGIIGLGLGMVFLRRR